MSSARMSTIFGRAGGSAASPRAAQSAHADPPNAASQVRQMVAIRVIIWIVVMPPLYPRPVRCAARRWRRHCRYPVGKISAKCYRGIGKRRMIVCAAHRHVSGFDFRPSIRIGTRRGGAGGRGSARCELRRGTSRLALSLLRLRMGKKSAREQLIELFRVKPGAKVRLADYDTGWAQTKELRDSGKGEVRQRAAKLLEENCRTAERSGRAALCRQSLRDSDRLAGP